MRNDLGCEENIIATGGDFTTCIDIHAADSENIIAVDHSTSDIFHTAVAIQEVLPSTPMVGAHALFELIIELELIKLVHLLENTFLTTNFLKDGVEVACNNSPTVQERIGVFVTKKRKTIADIFMRRKIM